LDIWFRSDKKCVFGAVIGRELGSRGQDLLVNCSSQMQLISRLLFTQYGIYMELFLLFWLSRVLGTSTCLGGTNVVGSRAHARALSEGT